jgi:succinate dehydrogenase / fumarate reductase membrane anchor subunit
MALAPLTLWLVASVAQWPGTGYEQFVAWVSAPWNTVLLLAFACLGFFHASLGVQVVIEDYVHVEWIKILAIIVAKLILGLAAVAAVFATLRIVFLG